VDAVGELQKKVMALKTASNGTVGELMKEVMALKAAVNGTVV